MYSQRAIFLAWSFQVSHAKNAAASFSTHKQAHQINQTSQQPAPESSDANRKHNQSINNQVTLSPNL
jgi:hypothetical protein